MSIRKLQGSGAEKSVSAQERQAKISDVREILGPIVDKLPVLCSDASISRYLRARNRSTKKAAKMLKETLKWRCEYRPEKIRWEEVAREAETGKVYRANYFDEKGRSVLIFRPGFQNTSDVRGQIKHLVYCMEKCYNDFKSRSGADGMADRFSRVDKVQHIGEGSSGNSSCPSESLP